MNPTWVGDNPTRWGERIKEAIRKKNETFAWVGRGAFETGPGSTICHPNLHLELLVGVDHLELLVGVDLVRGLLRDDIQVVLLEEPEVLAGLGELALLHTLADVPVDERALAVHHVVLLGYAAP